MLINNHQAHPVVALGDDVSVRRGLELLRFEAEFVGWLRWQSESFTDQNLYRQNYLRCLTLKLRSELLNQLLLAMTNGRGSVRQPRLPQVWDNRGVPVAPELDFSDLDERERALTEIAEQAREAVHQLGLLVQDLGF